MFKLPEINFNQAPFLSDETIQYHYGKHHRAYIDNLNKLMANAPPRDILDVIQNSEGAVFNNAAQSWNHTFYWLGLTPGPAPRAENSTLSNAIKEQFGTEAALKDKFTESALKIFGSGWAWLALNLRSHKLEVLNTSNADVIDFEKYTPLFICDVWEHAYYIDYRNSRANYLKDFWLSLNWQFIEDNYEKKNLYKVSELLMAHNLQQAVI